MKYFTLFSGQEVKLAPETKIVPKEEFSQAIDAFELIQKTKQDVQEYKKQTVAETEKIKQTAAQEGFEQALHSLNRHFQMIDEELQKLRDDIQKKILPLTLQAAKKILGEELKLQPERIQDIIRTALKPVTQHRKIVIYVHKADLQEVEKAKPELKELFERLEYLSIQEREDVEQGGCIIETEAGIINAQLETQWRSLEMAFEAYLKKDL
jgi:type III secretion protein L